VAVGEVGERLIAVNLNTGFYYTLNETAALILKAVRRGCADNEIVLEICAAYEVPEGAARRDLEECVRSMIEERLLVEQSG